MFNINGLNLKKITQNISRLNLHKASLQIFVNNLLKFLLDSMQMPLIDYKTWKSRH